MFELRERLPGMMEIRVGHCRVFALDIHAADRAGVNRIHDLDDGESALGIERGAPGRLEDLAQGRLLDRLVVRIDHRDEPRIGGALDIVLAAKRMKAGARSADLSRRERERDEATGVVRAVDMLRDAHSPENDRGARTRVKPRHLAQRLGGNPADLCHLLRREGAKAFLECLEALRVAGDVLLVREAFLHDRVEHGVQHRDVRARLEGEMPMGVAGERLMARIHHDELCASLFYRILDESCRNGVVLRGIGADDDDHLGVERRRERRCDRTGIRAPPSARRRRMRGRAACNGRHCSTRNRCARASGKDRPPRSSPWRIRSPRAPSVRERRAAL